MQISPPPIKTPLMVPPEGQPLASWPGCKPAGLSVELTEGDRLSRVLNLEGTGADKTTLLIQAMRHAPADDRLLVQIRILACAMQMSLIHRILQFDCDRCEPRPPKHVLKSSVETPSLPA